jgi:hypothetical protein
MKKQILFLAMFTMAMIFAGTGNVFGQLLPGVTAPAPGPNQPIDPLSCVAGSEPLHPFPGVPYTYSLTGNAGPEVAASYTWWATKGINFVSGVVAMPAGTNTNLSTQLTVATGDLVAAGTTYGVTTPAATVGSNSVQITWSADILSRTIYQTAVGSPGTAALPTSTFVVGYAEGENCADNIQVYEINPQPNFTIDIAAIDTVAPATLGWDINTQEYCVDVIQSAAYNPATFELTMDYGHNVIYYEVAAANFVTDWTPQFQIISGLRTTQTATISLHTTLANARSNTAPIWTSAALTIADLGTDITTGATRLSATNLPDVAVGVSVFVRVYIDNNTEESLSDNPFELAVDARDNNNTGIWDMEDEDCGVLVDNADQIDRSTITITPRPTLTHSTVDGGAPNPTTTIPKPSTSAAPNF